MSSVSLSVAGRAYRFESIAAFAGGTHAIDRLPYSLRTLLAGALRAGVAEASARDAAQALLDWRPGEEARLEIAFMPARVVLQDFTGVPCLVDLAAMRDQMARTGGDPDLINPLTPVELVIDHSVQVDFAGSASALERNVGMEYWRNSERYAFLKWGRAAFRNVTVVPPSTGIVHQVNLEHLARVVCADEDGLLYPDTIVGTDSHTTMVNGLGVLGWGVGGIEAEAAMLGQPISMLVPTVVGVRLTGELREGVLATDLVLTVTKLLREHGVVGKFVEFCGPGAARLTVADRATVANMAPEYGATCGFFAVDHETLRYLELTGRSSEHIEIVERYTRAQGLFADPGAPDPEFDEFVELDLASVGACAAGPRRPQDRVSLDDIPQSFVNALSDLRKAGSTAVDAADDSDVRDGSVVIAAITSCTNTSNPSAMVAAGLLARNARERGLSLPAWVKASLAPGSRVVADYLASAGLLQPLEELGFAIVGYGCTTCIGNSGPLSEDVSRSIERGNLVVCSVLSGNRNFEGRVHPEVRANYLMSPPMVVAYALAGKVSADLTTEPLAQAPNGRSVMLRDIWPSSQEIAETVERHLRRSMFSDRRDGLLEGDEHWRAIPDSGSSLFRWDEASSYIRRPPYFDGMSADCAESIGDIAGARVLAFLGDSVTTDHISPAGSIRADSPAGRWLLDQGIEVGDFNSYGSRRGNHEVMVRGTFANVRIRNRLAPGTEGGFTTHLPTGDVLAIYDAAMRYAEDGTPLLVLAGKEYGSGSSRDWAAKGPCLLGVRAVLAESFERIHRSNLVGMGILPLQFEPGVSAASLGLDGTEQIDVLGIGAALRGDSKGGARAVVRAAAASGDCVEFEAIVRIDTPQEREYYRHGGILQYVLRRLAAPPATAGT